MTFPVPEDCFQPDCRFRVTVDAKNEVEEIDEANNQSEGRCEAARSGSR